MPKKYVNRGFNVENKYFIEFKTICTKKQISMGSLVREWIEKYVEENKASV